MSPAASRSHLPLTLFLLFLVFPAPCVTLPLPHTVLHSHLVLCFAGSADTAALTSPPCLISSLLSHPPWLLAQLPPSCHLVVPFVLHSRSLANILHSLHCTWTLYVSSSLLEQNHCITSIGQIYVLDPWMNLPSVLPVSQLSAYPRLTRTGK